MAAWGFAIAISSVSFLICLISLLSDSRHSWNSGLIWYAEVINLSSSDSQANIGVSSSPETDARLPLLLPSPIVAQIK